MNNMYSDAEIIGTGTMVQLTNALNVLLAMSPYNEDGDAVFNDADLTAWRQIMKDKMLEENIDIETLLNLSTPSKVVSIGVTEHKILLSIGTEEDRPEEDGAHLVDYIAFFKWILSETTPVEDDNCIEDIEKSFRTRRITSLEFPIDPVNNKIWSLQPDHINHRLNINSAKSGTKSRVNIVVRLNWDDIGEGITITTPPDAYDKLVYDAVNALYQEGQNPMSLAMIYNAMGNDGQPGQSDKQRINDSVTKMSRAHIFLDNEQEILHKYKYPRFEWDGSLLPMERVSAKLNGKVVDGLIMVYRELPLFTFARDRKQITRIPRKVLQGPQNKTTGNLQIQDYLILRIAQAKTNHGKKKILYKTIFEHCRITSIKQKQRARPKVKQFMDHFVKSGFIAGATYSEDGVTIVLKPAKTS